MDGWPLDTLAKRRIGRCWRNSAAGFFFKRAPPPASDGRQKGEGSRLEMDGHGGGAVKKMDDDEDGELIAERGETKGELRQ